jgi:hypothetical protein
LNKKTKIICYVQVVFILSVYSPFVVISSSTLFVYAGANSSNGSNDTTRNETLAGLASLLSSNPNMSIGGISNQSATKPDLPAPVKGFLVDEEKGFRIFYPSTWTKDTLPSGKSSGLVSIPIVCFSPSYCDSDIRVTISKIPFVNQSSLRDLTAEEMDTLRSNPNFELNESSPVKLGAIEAQKIVYMTSIIRDLEIAGFKQSMEIITTKEGVPYFIVYTANSNEYTNYLPLVNRMVNSLEFK